jgi:hypothetical protein
VGLGGVFKKGRGGERCQVLCVHLAVVMRLHGEDELGLGSERV